jgi:hypothetical protein
MKILLLIMTSDGGTGNLYTRLQYEIWRKYMHSMPDKIESYFYKANPNIEESYIEGDTVYVKCEEKYPSALWKKLFLTLKLFELRFHEFDYIYRPTVSSFIVLERLYKELLDKPRTRYCVSPTYEIWEDSLEPSVYKILPSMIMPAGFGLGISMDIAKIIINTTLVPNKEGQDDLWLGILLHEEKVPIIHIDFLAICDKSHWKYISYGINNSAIYLFRIKHAYWIDTLGKGKGKGIVYYDAENRVNDDIAIHTLLLNKFYPE